MVNILDTHGELYKIIHAACEANNVATESEGPPDTTRLF
jgi:hypothetical protein